MQEIKTTEEYQKEVEITEEEIESYSGCSERTQRCLTDCPWLLPGYIISVPAHLRQFHLPMIPHRRSAV